MAEQFLQSIEERFEHLIKEAEESPEMEHPINPDSNAGRMQVIDYLVDPSKYGSQKAAANQNKARAIAAAIINQGENARLLDPENGSKVPIRHNKLVGGKTAKDVEQANQKTQDHELAVEMLMAAYNTPNGQETPFQLGVADPVMKENIKRGLIMMFNLFDDKGDPGPLLRMIYGNAFHSPNPSGLPPIPTRIVNGVEVKDTMAMREYAYAAYEHLLQSMDKILARNVSPTGQSDTGNWQKTMSYVTTIMRNKLKQDFKKENQKGDWTGVKGAPGYSLDRGFNDKDAKGAGDAKMFYATQKGTEDLFDLAKGDVGVQALKDIRDELINLDANKYKEFFSLPDNARMPKPKPHHIQALQLIIDNLQGERVHKDAEGNEYMSGKYANWADFLRDIIAHPPADYPALADFINKTQDFNKVRMNLGLFFDSKLFQMARDYVYKTKYAKIISPDAKSPTLGTTTAGDFFGRERQIQSDKWKKSGGEDEPEIRGIPMSQWGPDEYGEYYASMQEEEKFMKELSEAVGVRLFEHIVKTTIFG